MIGRWSTGIRARRERWAARFSWLRLALAALRADRRVVGAVLSAGVAFRLFLMLLPLALLTAALLGFVAGDSGSGAPGQVARQYGITYALAQTIASTSKEATSGRWVLLATGLILLLWTGNGVAQSLSDAFRVVWRMDPTGSRSLRASVVVCLGLSAAVGITMASSAIGAGSPALEIPITALVAISYFAIFLLVSAQLPHAANRWTSLVPGAALAAIGFTALHLGTALFAANRIGRASRLYGSFGLVSTIMFWLFLSGRILVGSAQLSAARWYRSH